MRGGGQWKPSLAEGWGSAKVCTRPPLPAELRPLRSMLVACCCSPQTRRPSTSPAWGHSLGVAGRQPGYPGSSRRRTNDPVSSATAAAPAAAPAPRRRLASWVGSMPPSAASCSACARRTMVGRLRRSPFFLLAAHALPPPARARCCSGVGRSSPPAVLHAQMRCLPCLLRLCPCSLERRRVWVRHGAGAGLEAGPAERAAGGRRRLQQPAGPTPRDGSKQLAPSPPGAVGARLPCRPPSPHIPPATAVACAELRHAGSLFFLRGWHGSEPGSSGGG